MRKVLFTIAVLVICVMVAGCSSGSDESGSNIDTLTKAATKQDSTGLKAAASLIAEGIITSDGNLIYRQLSSECQEEISSDTVYKQIRNMKTFLTNFVGADLNDFSVKSVDTQNVVDGKSGQARYTIDAVGKSKTAFEAYAKKLKAQNATSTTTTATVEPGSEQTTTTVVQSLNLNEPTDWYDFVYESSTWKLQDCKEFLQAAGLVQQTKQK